MNRDSRCDPTSFFIGDVYLALAVTTDAIDHEQAAPDASVPNNETGSEMKARRLPHMSTPRVKRAEREQAHRLDFASLTERTSNLTTTESYLWDS